MSEWISVKDRIPETKDPILACDKYGDIEIGSLYIDDDGYRRWSSQHGENESLIGVTHWQPLPPPPAEGE